MTIQPRSIGRGATQPTQMNENLQSILAIMSRMSDRIEQLTELRSSAHAYIEDLKNDDLPPLSADIVEHEWDVMCSYFNKASKLFESLEDDLINLYSK